MKRNGKKNIGITCLSLCLSLSVSMPVCLSVCIYVCIFIFLFLSSKLKGQWEERVGLIASLENSVHQLQEKAKQHEQDLIKERDQAVLESKYVNCIDHFNTPSIHPSIHPFIMYSFIRPFIHPLDNLLSSYNKSRYL